MKRRRIAKICITFCLIFGMLIMPVNGIRVQADEILATVYGKILTGTTAELLKLSTKDGYMEVKLDSGTDTSGCKILLPDKGINVSVSHGSDGYLHAVKITGDAQTPAAGLDTSTTATVTGTISDKTKGDIIYFNTSQGEMQIKYDASTSINCNVLVAGKNYYITCVRGSDAYMHATSISDSQGQGTVSSGAVNNNGATNSTTGTVVDKTREDLLYLSTQEGEMQFKIDSNADTSRGMVLTPGNKMTVAFYHGSDGYLHATALAGVKNVAAAAGIDSASTVTVNGTVGNKSNENILYLDTRQGTMELKLDAVSSVNCKVLVRGKKLTVTCARGSDAYMHAITIYAAGTEVSGTVNNGATMSVTGTAGKKTEEGLLYLSTKEGEMQFKIDSGADTSRGMVLTPGSKLTVSFYHGSDGYLHATGIVGVKDSSSAEIDTSSKTTVYGTVGSNSTENILYLNTAQGTMELKLDAVSSLNNCKVLISGRKLTVTCARGSDAYMHAIDITGS